MEGIAAMASKLKNSIQKLYIQHRRTSAQFDTWAEKAIRYREAGELRKAERAETRAFQCLTRMKRLADRWDLLQGLGSPLTQH
ncbi:MAG TPA: hypothetical protein VMU40_15735 [Steroidobacteraceae bacterium]|nr:hypothetical protein [Steroidobacteraceae bacterium]